MTEYDNMGREAKTWLPAVGTTSPVFISTSTMSTKSQSTYGGDAYAFSETTYDALGRPIFVSTPGDAWYQAGKGVRTEYKTNTANSVKRYVISPTTYTISQDGYYASGTLTCVRTTDEDEHSIEVYKDFMDKVVLERRAGGNDTYYVYNNQGLLCGVLPPLYQTQGNDDLIYQYKYDGYGRCIEKTLPECSPISYEYDKYGRLAFMKDGTMSGNSCRFYLYDQLNRLVIQGFCSGKNITPTTSQPATAVYGTGNTEITGTGYYISSAYSLVNPTIEIVNYYDNYQFLTHPALQDSIGNVSLSRTGHANATSFQTGQLVKTSNGRYLCTALYYNQKGQVVETCENTLNGVIHNTTTTYTFTGKPITVNESVTKNNTTRAVVQQNTYNANTDQLLTRTHQYGSTSITTGAYTYDDLGRLDSVSRYLDRTSVRYTYDLHGWLTNIHGHDHYHNQLLFNEKLHYADGSRTPYYNGNISCAKYTTPDYPMGQGNQCVYEYTYDGMNRLTYALFGYGPINSNNATFSAYFSESMTYDANSNIKTLMRYGKMNNGNYNAIDVLDYTYNGGNRLYSIIDHGQNLVTEGAFDFKDDLINSSYAPEYWYNSNGALSYDANKGVSWIDYDKLGNPIRVQFTDHSITEHVYAADGRRLKTIHRTSVPQSPSLGIGVTASLPSSLTQSIDSVDYVGNFIYEKGQLKRYMFDDGYLRLNTNNTCVPRFFIKDHLGNNRILTDGSGNIKQNTNYYPYGGMTSISTGQGEQQFKYNGKEYDPMHGLNEYDYGARQYDPARAQFTTMDPLCEKYYHISPYAYCGGNPVNAVDPDGRDWYKYNGQYQWRDSFDPYYTDKDGNKWERVKYHNFINRKTNTYYSLFGQRYSLNNTDLGAIIAIDNAIVLNAKNDADVLNGYQTEFEQTKGDFRNMYPIVKNKSFLRMETPYEHNIMYGDDNGNDLNAIITQVSNPEYAFGMISIKFEETTRKSHGLVKDKSGIGLVFINKSGKDIVNILFSQTTGKKNRAYYQKLVEYYINKQ
jgi:RHS repeat-associated protein